MELDTASQSINGSEFNIDVSKIGNDFDIIKNLYMLESFAWSPDSSKLAMIIRGNRCKELCILSPKRGEALAFFDRIHINTDELRFKLRDRWYKPKNQPVSEYTHSLVTYPNCNSSLAFTPDGQSLVVGHSVGIYDALAIGGEGINLGYYKRKMGLERDTPFENSLGLIQYFDVNFSDLPLLQILVPKKLERGFRLDYDEDGRLIIFGSEKQCAILPMEIFEYKDKGSILSKLNLYKKNIIGTAVILGFIGFSAFAIKKGLEKNKQKRKKRQRKNTNSKPKTQTLSS